MVVVGILGVPLAITLACLAIQARWYRRSHGGLEFLSARRILRMGERGVARVLARREVAQVYNPWNGYRGQRDSIIEYALEVRSDAGQVFRALSTLPDPDVVIGDDTDVPVRFDAGPRVVVDVAALLKANKLREQEARSREEAQVKAALRGP